MALEENDKHKQYFEYLKGISWKGKLYRQKFIYPFLMKHSKGSVLDLGCGIGEFLHFANCTGTDINADCVNFCLERGLDAHLMQEDKLPFSHGTYNTIILDNVLEHILEPTKILNECHRVLSDQGLLIIGVPGVKGFKSDKDHKCFYNTELLYNTLLKATFSQYRIMDCHFGDWAGY